MIHSITEEIDEVILIGEAGPVQMSFDAEYNLASGDHGEFIEDFHLTGATLCRMDIEAKDIHKLIDRKERQRITGIIETAIQESDE